MATANLDITYIGQGQNGSEAVANTAFDVLDNYSGVKIKTIVNGTNTLTEDESRAGLLVLAGALTAAATVQIHANIKKATQCINLTTGAQSVTVLYLYDSTSKVLAYNTAPLLYPGMTGTAGDRAPVSKLSKTISSTTVTLTDAEAANRIIEFSGTLTANTIVFVPASLALYTFKNICTGGFQLTVKTLSGLGVVIPTNSTYWTYCDGVNMVQLTVSQVTANTKRLVCATRLGWCSNTLGVNGLYTAARAINCYTKPYFPYPTSDVRVTFANFDNTSNQPQIIRSGTCQAGSTSTTIVLDSGANATDAHYVGARIKCITKTGAGQTALITAYVGATKTCTIDVAWPYETPDNTTTYEIYQELTIGVAAQFNSAANPFQWNNEKSGLELTTIPANGYVKSNIMPWNISAGVVPFKTYFRAGMWNSGQTDAGIQTGQYFVSADGEGGASGAPQGARFTDNTQTYSSSSIAYPTLFSITGIVDLNLNPRAIDIFGDSIDFGYTAASVATTGQFGVIAQGLGNQCGWRMKARAGEWLNNNVGAGIYRRLLDLDEVTHFSAGWFINDRNNGRTLAQIQADFLTWCNIMRIHSKTGTWRTALPLTLSTDSWATTANQTPFGITVTGATNASPIVIQWSGTYTRKVNTGDSVTISGVLGNTAANGTFTVTYVDATHFSLNGTTGSGAYTSGGMAQCNTMLSDLQSWNSWLLDTSSSGAMAASGGVVVGVHDVGNAVMSAPGSGKFAVDGTAFKYTNDGIHLSDAGVTLGASAVLLTKFI